MRRGLRLKRVGVVMSVAMAFGAVAVPQAPALTVGPLQVDIVVNTSDWSACGLVRDSFSGARYTAVLTATGYASTGLARSDAIAGQASHTGNPAAPCTAPSIDSTVAAVVYTLTWTSVVGTTGTMTKTCVETPPVSTESEIHIDPPIATASVSRPVIPPITTARVVCTVS